MADWQRGPVPCSGYYYVRQLFGRGSAVYLFVYDSSASCCRAPCWAWDDQDDPRLITQDGVDVLTVDLEWEPAPLDRVKGG